LFETEAVYVLFPLTNSALCIILLVTGITAFVLSFPATSNTNLEILIPYVSQTFSLNDRAETSSAPSVTVCSHNDILFNVISPAVHSIIGNLAG
jgi:hypothetical protein